MVNSNVFDPSLIWFASASISFCLALALVTCVCGCRKKVPKNELLGLAGLVKITNPDENVNFSSAPPNLQLNSVTVISDDIVSESNDSSKRNSNAVATATRSLPDLPVDSGDTSEKLWPPTENNADTNSDLYATVEDAVRKKKGLTSGLTVNSSGYTPSQTDDSLSPYARLRGEHPYDQLKQNEHPYAQVGPNGAPIPSTSQETPVNSTPSSRRGTVLLSEVEDGNKSPSLNDQPEEIAAASAIAGSVPANHDLPYMTPPIPSQQHFSGDSVDSSKGYTSISVREPLSQIRATTARGVPITDPHYATVSDDSDEMYAAIEDCHTSGAPAQCATGAGEYTSGSETYAQIAAPASSHNPPNLSLIIQHQDSVSTCSSESPRRERRVANSPLPQVPALDEMYAKVVKKGRSPTSPEPPENGPVLPSKVGDEEGSSLPGYETVNPMDPNYEELELRGEGEPDYASLLRPSLEGSSRHRFHSTEDLPSLSDPNYESVDSTNDPPYERVNNLPSEEQEQPDYETVCSRPGQALSSISDLYAQVNKSSDKNPRI